MQEDDRDALAGPDAREQRALGGQCDLVSGGASVHGRDSRVEDAALHRGTALIRHPETAPTGDMLGTTMDSRSSVGSLVGREIELGLLDTTLDGLDGGEPACLTVEGEPGIGKTRLLNELRARAEERGHVVLAGAAAEFEREMPFSVWVDALDAYVASQGLSEHEAWDSGPGELSSARSCPPWEARTAAPPSRTSASGLTARCAACWR